MNWWQVLLMILGILVGVALLLLIVVSALLYFILYSREMPAYGKILFGGQMDSDTTNAAERTRVRLAKETEEYIAEHEPEELKTRAFDGIELVATLLRGSTKSKKVMILLHGYRAEANWDFGGMVQFYHERGYNVLLPDNRGHRRSGGKLIGFGYLDRLDAIQWAKKMTRMFGQGTEIVLSGVSMGASAVMNASGEASLPREVKAIIEDCGFSSVIGEFEYMFPKQIKFLSKPVLFICSLISMIFNKHSLYKNSPVKALQNNTRPILFFHGEDDDFIPPVMMEECYKAANGPKEYMLVPVARHAQSCDVNPDLYKKKVSDFLEEYVHWDPTETLVVLPKDPEDE